eukprot:g5082.t1
MVARRAQAAWDFPAFISKIEFLWERYCGASRRAHRLGRQRGHDRHVLRFQSLRSRLHHSAARPVLALLFHLRGGDRGVVEDVSRPTLKEVRGGWHLASLANQKEISEAKIVRDLLFALQGVSSDCFDSSCEVDPAVLLTRPAWLLCHRILGLAKLHLRLSTDAKDIYAGEESWFKVLPKPSQLDAKNREEELAQWRDFSWGLEQYLSSLNGMFTEDFKDIRARPDDPIKKQRSKFLYSLLASLVKQRPLAVIHQVKESNGMEAYRLLVQSLEPTSKNRALGLLTMILEWKPFEMRKGSILGQVLRLEEAFVEYEKTGSKLEDNIRFAVLMRCIGGQLKTWLQLNVAESQNYQKLREAIIQYDNATMKWTNVMMLGADPNNTDGVVPMEIDRIKGKGNDKGKGKDFDEKGKGKGDPKGKGKGKSHGKSQDFGGKSQQKGSGKGEGQKGQKGKADQKTCYTCLCQRQA